jgi:GrpB-like predicted nucleotidyltransferase (UPF0157 family)
MRIVLAAADPSWPLLFAEERERLRSALADTAVIEHIGSTSVPCLIAKPVLDILIGLDEFSSADELVPKIVALGYRYFPEYESEMPYRRFFTRDLDTVRTHHIHMVQRGGDFWDRHLLFRDYLRENPSAAREYARLKIDLATRDWKDGNEYASAKTGFIRAAEVRAKEYFHRQTR